MYDVYNMMYDVYIIMPQWTEAIMVVIAVIVVFVCLCMCVCVCVLCSYFSAMG